MRRINTLRAAVRLPASRIALPFTCTLVLGVVLVAVGSCGSGGGSTTTTGSVWTWHVSNVRVNDGTSDFDHEAPALAVHENLVYVVWMDARDGDSSIYFNRSDDGGTTWLTSDRRLDTPPAGVAKGRWPLIACADLRVYVIWADQRDGAYDVYFNHSEDGGLSWQATDTRLDTDLAGSGASVGPDLCCAGDHVYVAWQDHRAGNADVYARASTNRGNDWPDPEQRLDLDPEPGQHDSSGVSIACDGGHVYVGWADDRNGQDDVHLRRSQDGGTSWENAEHVLDTNTPGSADSWLTDVATVPGGGVHAVWNDDRTVPGLLGQTHTLHNRSANFGASWLSADERFNTNTQTAVHVGRPFIATHEQYLLVGWDFVDGAFTEEVRVRRSIDGGLTWGAFDETAYAAPAAVQVNYYSFPGLACDPNAAYVVWNEDRTTTNVFDLYLTYASWGSGWTNANQRVNSPPAGTVSVQEAVVQCGADKTYVVWADRRNGALEIFCSVGQP